MLALVFSVLGAVVLTAFVWWGVYQLLPGVEGWREATEPQRLHTIRWVLWIATGALAGVLLGLGMAINRRSFKGNIGTAGFDFQGGDGDTSTPAGAAQATAAAAERTAEEISARELPEVGFGKDER